MPKGKQEDSFGWIPHYRGEIGERSSNIDLQRARSEQRHKGIQLFIQRQADKKPDRSKNFYEMFDVFRVIVFYI
jgi:hypothetical protein